MARKASSIKNRKTGTKLPKPKILIVCEGEKTEVDYLNLFRKKLNLANIIIKIESSNGPAPISVVKYARVLNKAEIQQYGESEQFESTFCLYDTDTDKHKSLQQAKELAKKYRYVSIISNPCFEYWLLLHYTYTRTLFSNSNECIKTLKKHLPLYEKNNIRIHFKELMSKLEDAKDRSKKSCQDAKKDKEDNPSTNMHELIEKLETCKK
jgi:hypothetical protein